MKRIFKKPSFSLFLTVIVIASIHGTPSYAGKYKKKPWKRNECLSARDHFIRETYLESDDIRHKEASAVSLGKNHNFQSDKDYITALNQELDYWAKQTSFKDPASEKTLENFFKEFGRFEKRRLSISQLTDSDLSWETIDVPQLSNRDLLIFAATWSNISDISDLTESARIDFKDLLDDIQNEIKKRGYALHEVEAPIGLDEVNSLSLSEIRSRVAELNHRALSYVIEDARHDKPSKKSQDIQDEISLLRQNYLLRGGSPENLEQMSCTIL